MRRITYAMLAAALLAAGCATRDGWPVAQHDACVVAALVDDAVDPVSADGSVETRFRFTDLP